LTQKKLVVIASDLQAKLGRRVTYAEAINYLIDDSKQLSRARTDFAKLFGSLKGSEQESWNDLKSLRQEWDKRLEKSVQTRKK
jgi:hypothetical protein